MSRYPELSDFSIAFANAYRGFMKEMRITGRDIAAKLGRNVGYVSERVNGKRPLDTADVDALALLVGGDWTGRTLMIELAKRARLTMNEEQAENVGLANVSSLDDRREALLEQEEDMEAVASERRHDDEDDADGYHP